MAYHIHLSKRLGYLADDNHSPLDTLAYDTETHVTSNFRKPKQSVR